MGVATLNSPTCLTQLNGAERVAITLIFLIFSGLHACMVHVQFLRALTLTCVGTYAPSIAGENWHETRSQKDTL